MSSNSQFYSLDATIHDFEDTENTIVMRFDQLAKEIQEIRPQKADFSNITLPRNQIVSQLQKYLAESSEKEKILNDLQDQIVDFCAKAAFRAEVGDLKAQIDDMNQEIENEKSNYAEIEERIKPYYDEYKKLQEEIESCSEYENTMKSYEYQDYSNETDEIVKQTEVFLKKKNDLIKNFNDEKVKYEEKLKIELEKKEKLMKKPIPKTTAGDVINFKKDTIEKIKNNFTSLMIGVDAILTKSLKPNTKMKGKILRRSTNQLLSNQARKIVTKFNENYQKEMKEKEELEASRPQLDTVLTPEDVYRQEAEALANPPPPLPPPPSEIPENQQNEEPVPHSDDQNEEEEEGEINEFYIPESPKTKPEKEISKENSDTNEDSEESSPNDASSKNKQIQNENDFEKLPPLRKRKVSVPKADIPPLLKNPNKADEDDDDPLFSGKSKVVSKSPRKQAPAPKKRLSNVNIRNPAMSFFFAGDSNNTPAIKKEASSLLKREAPPQLMKESSKPSKESSDDDPLGLT